MTARQPEVLIVGGGVIGACSAYFLAKAGRRVTLLEKGEICSGSSHGNAGLTAYSHVTPLAAPGVLAQSLRWLLRPYSPFHIKPRLDPELLRWLWHFRAACSENRMRSTIPVLLALGQASRRLHVQLHATENLHCDYQYSGRLYVFNSRTHFEAGLHEAELLRGYGVETRVLAGAELQRTEPHLLPSVIGGIYYPDYGSLIPDRFVHALAQAARRLGVAIESSTEVRGFEISGRRITAVRTERGDHRAEEVVLAAGAFTPLLARPLGLRLPIQPAKGYSLTMKKTAACPQLPLSLEERKLAATPMGDRLRLCSALELVGYDSAINPRRVAAIYAGARDYLAKIDESSPAEPWCGFRPLTPDSLPIIGRSPQHDNLTIAAGHGTLGITQGPVTGQLVTQLLAAEQPDIDLHPLRVSRFPQPR